MTEIDRIADAIIDLQNREDTTLPALRQQLKDCEQGIENMLNAIQMGILTPSTKTRLEELESRRESLKVSILQAELEKPKYTKEQIVSWINRFKYGNVDDIEYQRQIIDTFINAIYVFRRQAGFHLQLQRRHRNRSSESRRRCVWFGFNSSCSTIICLKTISFQTFFLSFLIRLKRKNKDAAKPKTCQRPILCPALILRP